MAFLFSQSDGSINRWKTTSLGQIYSSKGKFRSFFDHQSCNFFIKRFNSRTCATRIWVKHNQHFILVTCKCIKTNIFQEINIFSASLHWPIRIGFLLFWCLWIFEEFYKIVLVSWINFILEFISSEPMEWWNTLCLIPETFKCFQKNTRAPIGLAQAPIKTKSVFENRPNSMSSSPKTSILIA